MTEESIKKLLIATMAMAAILVLVMIVHLPKMPSQLPVDNSQLDTDGDGLPDPVEKAIGTDPNKQDTDGDGFDDLTELKKSYDPLNSQAGKKLDEEEFALMESKIQDTNPSFFKSNFASGAIQR